MGRGDLIGNGPNKLIPLRQPAMSATKPDGARKGRPFRTQHTCANRSARSGVRHLVDSGARRGD